MTRSHKHATTVSLLIAITLFSACEDTSPPVDKQLISEDRGVSLLPADQQDDEDEEPTVHHAGEQGSESPAVAGNNADPSAMEAERKRRLNAEVQNKSVLGQIGSASVDGSSEALAEGAGEARGFGGLGMAGAGRRGGGVSEAGIGLSNVGTRGKRAMRGEGGTLVVGRGAGGLGMRGTGKGGGGESFGRIGGLGMVGTGSSSGDVVPKEPVATSESYEDHGVNEMTKTSKDKLSTFSIDVDTGAYTIARRKLNEGILPPAASVRVEEFVNYFNYNYPQPDSEGPFGVSLEAAPSPFTSDANRYLLRVGVQGKRIAQKERKPVHLVFLVDVSGSMSRRDKLGLAKESLKVLVNNLSENDTVGLVTYAGNTRAVLEPTSATDKGKIFDGIDSLTSGGGTAMNSGMETAYKMAMQSAKPGHVTRVVVLSDGDANIGPSSFDDILKHIKSYVDEGVTMSTIGFGMGNYKDSLMEQLANKGNGNYYYIDSIDEARKVFGEQVDGTLEVIAKDVKIQVEFNPDTVDSYRLIGYENRDIADKDFRNDKVDAGEIGAGHSVTAFYEISLKSENPDGTLAYVRMRHKKPDGYDATEQVFNFESSELVKKLSMASKDFQFGAAVVAFAEILRKSPYAKDLSFDLVKEVAQSSSSSSQKDRQEFIGLIDKARTL